MRRAVVMTALISVAGCGVSVAYAPFRSTATTRQLSGDAVDVFFTPPQCPFVELGMLETQTRLSIDKALFAMREEAGAHGADGIVLVDHQDIGDHKGRTSHSARAIAIARDASCTLDPAPHYVGQVPGHEQE
jgi:hypothetical protein